MQVKLTQRSFIDGALHEAGEIVEIADDKLSDHMEPVNKTSTKTSAPPVTPMMLGTPTPVKAAAPAVKPIIPAVAPKPSPPVSTGDNLKA